MKHIYFLFSIVFLVGCKREKTLLKYSPIHSQILTCLNHYGHCDSLVNLLSAKNDEVSIYLKAKWLMRQGKHNEALLLFDPMLIRLKDMDLRDTIYQNIILDASLAKVSSNSNMDFVFNMLRKINAGEEQLPNNFKARFYSEYSNALGKIFRFSEAIVFGILAEKLIENEDENLLRKFQIRNSMLYSEEKYQNSYLEGIDVKKIREALCEDVANPDCIHAYGLLKFHDPNISIREEKILDSLTSLFIEYNYYNPIIKNTHVLNNILGTKSKVKMIQNLKVLIDESKKNKDCRTLFNSTAYLIREASEEKILNLEMLLQMIDDFDMQCGGLKNDPSFTKNYIILLQKAKLHAIKFESTLDTSFFNKSIYFATLARSLSSKIYKAEVGIHYEDLASEINDVIISNYFVCTLNNINFDNNSYINELSICKDFNIKLSENKKPISAKRNELDILNNNKAEINKLKLGFNNYKDIENYSVKMLMEIANLYIKNNEITRSFKYNYIDVNNKETKEVSDYLNKTNSLVIDFSTFEDHYYLSAITGTDIKLKKIDKPLIDSLVTTYQHSITNKANFETLKKQSNQLYNLLVKPYLSPDIKNIIIIPDNNLHNLPFEALIDDDKSNPQYLVNKYNISYHYNIGEMNLTSPKNKRNPTASLLSYSDKNTIVNNTSKISELAFGFQEAKNIAKLYVDPLLITGKKATNTNFIKCLNSDVVHLSTHTFSDPSQMYGNYILLRDKSTLPSQFYGFELNKIELPNNHIILSSCSSGKGISHFGAGTFSLSRDFLQAGARSVVKTLWSVNDASTTTFMLDYHKNLKSHNTSKALVETKRRMLKHPKYSHPFYWAAFLFEGD